jgi:translation elongation factor EF-Ts
MSAELPAINKLREATGATFTQAFRALQANNGDVDAAMAALADGAQPPTAAPKAQAEPGRHGTVFAYAHHDRQGGALVEVSTASDFAARTPTFLGLGPLVAALAYGHACTDPAALLGVDTPGGETLGERLARVSLVLGERVEIVRIVLLRAGA